MKQKLKGKNQDVSGSYRLKFASQILTATHTIDCVLYMNVGVSKNRPGGEQTTTAQHDV